MELLTAPHEHLDQLIRCSLNPPAHPVIRFRGPLRALDLSTPHASFSPVGELTVGRYDEIRPSLYQSALFREAEGLERCVHMGVDIGSPEGTPVLAWADSVLCAQGALPSEGDYGHSIILRTPLLLEGEQVTLWSLYGHLSARSIRLRRVGQSVARGEVIGELGALEENGGWPPHLHFQLSWREPPSHDLPGVVSLQDRQHATWTFPDPRIILGPLY